MKILVTGANGYIGSKLVKKLCAQGHSVVAVDLSDGHIDKRAQIHLADIFGDGDYFKLFGEPEVCLHLAWKDGFIHNSDSHIEQLSEHYRFIRKMLDGGLKRVCVMGTMHEVGYHEGKVDENTPANPVTKYGTAKNALRNAVEILCRERGATYQWLRAFYIYGDDDFGNSVFCRIRQASREGKELFPFTSGKNQFDFIHISDLCEQISRVITQDKVNGVINVCSGKPKSLGEQVEEYIAEHNLKIKLDYGKFPERPSESPCIYGDNTKISKIMAGS